MQMNPSAPSNGRPDLRLIVVTDRSLAAPRNLFDIVRACLEAGAPAVQLRDKTASARELFEQAQVLRAMTRAHDALLFVNDRLDVALAAAADGVHVGPHDLPLRAAREITPPGFLIGYSTDDPETARLAQEAGADYIGCGAVFGTTTKAEARGEKIGPDGLAAVARAVTIPVIGIGGIDIANVEELQDTGAAGIAVVGAIMKSPDPEATTRSLLNALGPRSAVHIPR